jgi:SAM-dependent methyltransferase
MQSSHYEALRKSDGDYWWFKVRYQLVWQCLQTHAAGMPVVDVGCGTGGFLRWLRDEKQVPAVDLSGYERNQYACDVARQHGLAVVTADLDAVPAAAWSQMAGRATLLDVVEHFVSPGVALRNLARALPNVRHLTLTVPALPFLWSSWDEKVGHQTRFTKASLRRVLAEGGWKMQFSQYVFLGLLPPATLRAKAPWRMHSPQLDFPAVPRWLDTLLTIYFRQEARLGRHLPIGTSIVAAATRVS